MAIKSKDGWHRLSQRERAPYQTKPCHIGTFIKSNNLIVVLFCEKTLRYQNNKYWQYRECSPSLALLPSPLHRTEILQYICFRTNSSISKAKYFIKTGQIYLAIKVNLYFRIVLIGVGWYVGASWGGVLQLRFQPLLPLSPIRPPELCSRHIKPTLCTKLLNNRTKTFIKQKHF